MESPPESATESELEGSDASDDDDDDANDNVPVSMVDLTSRFAKLAALRSSTKPLTNSSIRSPASATFDAAEIDSDSESEPDEPEIVQHRMQIHELVSQLFNLSMIIRNPTKQDRYARSASTNVAHFDLYDREHIETCSPLASVVLQKRLTRAMMLRRKVLTFNQRRHTVITAPRKESASATAVGKAEEKAVDQGQKDTETQRELASTIKSTPRERSLGGNMTQSASQQPTHFVPPDDSEDGGLAGRQSDLASISTFTSTKGSGEKVRIPRRPVNGEGKEEEQFQCRYCFYPVEIKSHREWKYVIPSISSKSVQR
jgi:hypothetical protein